MHRGNGRGRNSRGRHERYPQNFGQDNFRGPSYNNNDIEEDWDSNSNSNRRPVNPSEEMQVDQRNDSSNDSNSLNNQQNANNNVLPNRRSAGNENGWNESLPSTSRERNFRNPNQWTEPGNIDDSDTVQLPEHHCDRNKTKLPNTLPTPPRGFARLICPDCYQPVFVKEKAKWVEYPRIMPGDHPYDIIPPRGYNLDSNCTPWWHQQCANCARWNHTACLCDQILLSKRCSFCKAVGHEIIECRKRQKFHQQMGIRTIRPNDRIEFSGQYDGTKLCKCNHALAFYPENIQEAIPNTDEGSDWGKTQPPIQETPWKS